MYQKGLNKCSCDEKYLSWIKSIFRKTFEEDTNGSGLSLNEILIVLQESCKTDFNDDSKKHLILNFLSYFTSEKERRRRRYKIKKKRGLITLFFNLQLNNFNINSKREDD